MKEELLLVTVPPLPPFQNCRWRCRRKIVRSAAVCDGLKVENRKRFLVHWWQWWRQIKWQKEGKKVLRNYQQVFAISAEAFRKRIYIDGGSNGHDCHLHNDDEPHRFESQLQCKCWNQVQKLEGVEFIIRDLRNFRLEKKQNRKESSVLVQLLFTSSASGPTAVSCWCFRL